MCATFTQEDEGKDVVNANGDQIGIVSEVDAGTAYVNPDPGMTDTLKSQLGWGDADDEKSYPIDNNNVKAVTDREIRLKRT
ncbi:PRC-barrel domain-containing protein [Natronococcus sp. A-GB1]|uniref:PRC-barrel domain-containing protein n=1 Tax=Natronococcus sp. A-GB1 TaxID=3037648 RepID=UPI00241D0C3C|nr:PRC-barrel domain-containing protein [Natronococcus sp. A-GB1]MDG5757968.1 PRC-barrel domain-containing protein [Natronococcus sp. A-GB1]